MEWGRAKSILIVSFLCLNMLLGYQLWASMVNLEQSNPGTAVIAEEIHQLLADKGVVLEATLPTDTPKMKEITVKYSADMKPGLRVKLSKPVEGSNVSDKAELKDILAKQVPFADTYQLDSVTSIGEDPAVQKEGVYIMHQLYSNYPMFEVKLELFYNSEMIDSYIQSYVEVQSGQEQKEQKVLSAITAVGSLAENYLQAGTVIKDVRLGYHGQIYNSETQVLAPSWRIATANGELFFVHAINGASMPSTEK